MDAMPMPLRWLRPARHWEADGSRLVIEAAGKTDWFVDPSGADPVTNAPALVGERAGDFVLSARVRVDFRADFDAGVLMLHARDEVWAKLCFEYSPQREPMVVSVVTNGTSDDANAVVVDGDHVWLRIAGLGRAFAFHASTDGRVWQLIRYFSLGDGVEPAVGFEAQSPTGEGCIATFDEISYRPARLEALRDGS